MADVWDDVGTFMQNVIDAIDRRVFVGKDARVALFVYGSDAQIVASLDTAYPSFTLKSIVQHLITVQAGDNHTSGGDDQVSGVDDALYLARQHMRGSILGRLEGRSTAAQAVILFKHGTPSEEAVDRARSIMYWFLDSSVPTTVVGECVCGFYCSASLISTSINKYLASLSA